MSDFKAKMHQIRFRLGLRTDPAGGAYSAPPDPLAGFKGPTSKGREGKWRKGRGTTPTAFWTNRTWFCRFSKWQPQCGKSTFNIYERQKLCANKISMNFLNPRLRYYYFRFLTTNGRHVERLLSVWSWPSHSHQIWFCIWPPKFYPNWTILGRVKTP